MLSKGMTNIEIEKELVGKGDFVRIDHLTMFLKEDLSVETRKAVSLMLADIYEKRKMFSEAAKVYESIAIYSVTYSDKIKHFVKEAELYIKTGMFERADEAMKKAMSHGSDKERKEVTSMIKDFYKRQAEVYEKELRRANAVKIYEKLLEMSISDLEREEIKTRLMGLYEKLGKVREYFTLKGR